jgi:threonine dehydrogenase-like Zn-dependent dehydrogenase
MESANILLTAQQQVELCRQPIPSLPADGLLARTQVSLISTGTECICYHGNHEPGSHWANWVKYPFNLGYSNVARVEQVGPQVEGYEVGDRIFTTSNHHQWIAVKPPAVKIPDQISDEAAAWSKLAVISQTGVRRAQLQMGAKVAIIGLGPLGQLLTQYVRLMGAEQVLAIDPIEGRLEIARAHGATQSFAGSDADAVDFVESHTNGNLADVVFDATGHYAVFPLALKLTRSFGTMMLIGDSPQPSKQVLQADVITRQITIRGLPQRAPATRPGRMVNA